MNEKVQRAEITTKPALYRLAGMEEVRVVPDIVYRSNDSGTLTMDVYYPPDSCASRRASCGYPGRRLFGRCSRG
jgi:hypothetical protein